MYRYFFIGFIMNLYLFASPLKILEANHYPVNAHLEYVLDQNYSIDEIFFYHTWKDSIGSFNTFKNRDKAYWAKLVLKNSTSSPKSYYIQVENKPIYHIEFFLLHREKIIKYHEDGAVVKHPKRFLGDTHILFPITFKANETLTVFMKIKNFNKNKIHFSLINERYMLRHYPLYNFFEALFFGGMFVLIFYNFILYFFLKLNIHLYYVFYTFWISVYFLGFMGYISTYFPDLIFLYHLSSGGIFISLNFFVQSLLKLKEELPEINRVFLFFNLYFVLSRLLYIYLINIDDFYFAQLLFNISWAILIFYALFMISVAYYLAQYKYLLIAKAYGLVWVISLIMILLLAMTSLHIIVLPLSVHYLAQVVVFFEVLSFSLLLAYKIKFMEQEKKKQHALIAKQSKLASMGEMISLIAHQWRQPLSELNGLIMMISLEENKAKIKSKKIEYRLNQMEDTTSYMSKTINDFMYLFSNNKKIESFYIIDVIRQAKKMAIGSEFKEVDIIFPTENEVKISGYQSELIQALLIIFNNAIYACQKDKSIISSITVDIHSTKDEVILYIEDNGGGIDEKILSHVFKPYYTTKEKSTGTGLGLYTLKIIIEESMHGKVYLSNNSKGILCKLILPKDLNAFIPNTKDKNDKATPEHVIQH